MTNIETADRQMFQALQQDGFVREMYGICDRMTSPEEKKAIVRRVVSDAFEHGDHQPDGSVRLLMTDLPAAAPDPTTMAQTGAQIGQEQSISSGIGLQGSLLQQAQTATLAMEQAAAAQRYNDANCQEKSLASGVFEKSQPMQHSNQLARNQLAQDSPCDTPRGWVYGHDGVISLTVRLRATPSQMDLLRNHMASPNFRADLDHMLRGLQHESCYALDRTFGVYAAPKQG